MRVSFRKMHGAGNDFVVLDERTQPLCLTRDQIIALADRRRGIGCDQLITVGLAEAADARLRFFNPDGGEAGACGNGTRCVAAWLMGEAAVDRLSLRTAAGPLAAWRLPDDKAGPGLVWVDMGPARVGWQDIPLAGPADTLWLPLPGEPAAVSVGNPHVTFFTSDVDAAAERGPATERNPMFPEGANVGFAHVLAPDRLRLRVWERGAGLTLACGSAACAAVVNAHRRGLAGRKASVLVDGGTLAVVWREDNHVEMTGPVAFAYRGTVDLPIHSH